MRSILKISRALGLVDEHRRARTFTVCAGVNERRLEGFVVLREQVPSTRRQGLWARGKGRANGERGLADRRLRIARCKRWPRTQRRALLFPARHPHPPPPPHPASYHPSFDSLSPPEATLRPAGISSSRIVVRGTITQWSTALSLARRAVRSTSLILNSVHSLLLPPTFLSTLLPPHVHLPRPSPPRPCISYRIPSLSHVFSSCSPPRVSPFRSQRHQYPAQYHFSAEDPYTTAQSGSRAKRICLRSSTALGAGSRSVRMASTCASAASSVISFHTYPSLASPTRARTRASTAQ